MKKVLLSLAVVLLAGNALELKAFKKVGTKAPAAVKKTGPSPVTPTKVVVVTEAQKAQLEQEFEKVLLDLNKAQNKRIAIAMSLGNQEDAEDFYEEMEKRIEAFGKKMGEPKKPDFSTLPSKSQPAQRKELTDSDRAQILNLAKSWNKADAMDKYQEYLKAHNLEFDDRFLGQVMNAAQ